MLSFSIYFLVGYFGVVAFLSYLASSFVFGISFYFFYSGFLMALKISLMSGFLEGGYFFSLPIIKKMLFIIIQLLICKSFCLSSFLSNWEIFGLDILFFIDGSNVSIVQRFGNLVECSLGSLLKSLVLRKTIKFRNTFLIFFVPFVLALMAATAAALYFLAYGFNLSIALVFFNGFFF